MRSISGKVVLVTGASRGLGVDIARRFASHGARLVLAARSADELELLRKELESGGVTAVAIPADVAKLESLRGLVEKTEQVLGPIDVLVNNAGVEAVLDFELTSVEDLEHIIAVNLTGLILLTRLVVPSMIERGSGHIVNVASLAGLVGVPHNAVYSATKHAVVGLSRSLRLELADHGVGVSAVCPGFVEGGMFLQHGRKPPGMTGWVKPERVAEAVVDAVLRDRGEVVVAKGLGKVADIVQAAAPGFGARVMSMTGVVDFYRDLARSNREHGKGRSS